MNFAPICFFAYKRLDCTRQTLEALRKNVGASQSKLFIFSDGAKKPEDEPLVAQVRAYLDQVEGFEEVKIYKRAKNWGLAKSIISGVSEVINTYKKVIVLEDDIATSANFLTFMNQALDFYEANQAVFSVGGYTFPIQYPADYPYQVYFAPRASSWGWATWADRWASVDWEVKDFAEFSRNPKLIKQFNQGGSDMFGMLKKQQAGKLDSWAIRWGYQQFKNQQQTVFPTSSKVQNIGFGDNASNTKFYNRFATDLDESNALSFKMPDKVVLNDKILKAFRNKASLWTRVSGRIKYYLRIK
jgi:hypothetical protein